MYYSRSPLLSAHNVEFSTPARTPHIRVLIYPKSIYNAFTRTKLMPRSLQKLSTSSVDNIGRLIAYCGWLNGSRLCCHGIFTGIPGTCVNILSLLHHLAQIQSPAGKICRHPFLERRFLKVQKEPNLPWPDYQRRVWIVYRVRRIRVADLELSTSFKTMAHNIPPAPFM